MIEQDNYFLAVRKWLKNHRLAFIDSIKTLYNAPLANLLTVLVLGIALALPVLLSLIILNINTGINHWQQSFYQYSIYLDKNIEQQNIETIKYKLLQWPEVENIQLINKEQGLEELKTAMGIGDILNNIEDNPLPNVLIVKLKQQYHSLENIKNLVNKTNKFAGVSQAESDTALLEELTNLLEIFSYMVYIFSLVLGTAILLVISNTIRLNLDNKQQEMILTSLLGATMSYIRRPYLYGGILYGLFAGLIAYTVASYLFNKLYYLVDTMGYIKLLNINLIQLSYLDILILLFLSSILGWLGARCSLYIKSKRFADNLSRI